MTPQELFDAFDRGEEIEFNYGDGYSGWERWEGNSWYRSAEFRIVKKEMSLAEELREAYKKGRYSGDLLCRCADRLDELEECMSPSTWSTEELLDELKRRMV